MLFASANTQNPVNTPDRIRTCGLQNRKPFRAFASIVAKMVYTCQIKTYEVAEKQPKPNREPNETLWCNSGELCNP
jgi:hypothetical protein